MQSQLAQIRDAVNSIPSSKTIRIAAINAVGDIKNKLGLKAAGHKPGTRRWRWLVRAAIRARRS